MDFEGGINQVTQSDASSPEYIFINNIYAPLVIAGVAVVLCFVLTCKYFKWKD
ncbi:hypothetical protein [Spiroplasma clarkii]|uniref:hypothetical protein n=1 Tax=Spiroplasma clarkii TaxID=2139 RepID=UPI001649E6CA|nr:hypothetical protein [Spiroplasma clarkii]